MSRISQLTYAIGDIHGYDEAFARLIEGIRLDAEALGERPRIVLLGDYVDRGPASDKVLERILRLEHATWCDLIAVKGNHEDALLRFLDDPESGVTWREWGGAATLAAYGVDMPFVYSGLNSGQEHWQGIRDTFARAIAPSHIDLLQRMPAVYQADDYLFVHAGVDPDVPLAEQGPDTFMYIRGPFLRAEKACEFVVVHGHTPEREPVNMPWRIDVDTGIYFNGVLTAVRLHGEDRAFLQVRLKDAP